MWRRNSPLVSVVVPVHDVEPYVVACLSSLLAQTHRRLEVIVVDDGSTDRSAELAEQVAAGDDRVRVVRTPNRGLGAARNEGVRHVTGDLLAFADSDDLVPTDAYSTMVGRILQTRADLVTGNIARLEDDELVPVPWMSRLHPAERTLTIDDCPDLLGDVFAWNKLFGRDFWEQQDLSWPEGVRYEDQPTSTEAFLAARKIAVTPEVVYHWRIRSDGSSITQQRASVTDLADRWATKQLTLESVRRRASEPLELALLERILPADMWRYFVLIPEADDAWWDLLVAGVRELWGEHSLTHSVLPPVHRLTGWLVEQDRRADAVTVIGHLRGLAGARVARAPDGRGGTRLEIPGLDPESISAEALAVRPSEA
ncbi:glycosyltransferase family 2 protein [Nocardioides cynanchi]|uniref:glycosyltransferase family 2 protein n=1 Tax=Nocardioides cynanchi TaxID=2558918 RepID=UPI001247B301|nr:glycosyltransferase family 2 protein [Nocardioides cynanchi]